jgi:hypothetical protein
MGQPPDGARPTANSPFHWAYSPDGRYAAYVGTTPQLILYAIQDNRYIRLPNIYPAVPTTAYGVSFSRDSSMVVIHCGASPFVLFCKIEFLSFRRAMLPRPAPAGVGRDVAFSGTGEEMMVAHDALNYVSIYDYVEGEGYEIVETPTPEPPGQGLSVAFYEGNEND